MSKLSLKHSPGYLFVVPWEAGNPGGVDQVVLSLFGHFAHGHEFRPILMIASWQFREPDEVEKDGRLICKMRLRSPYWAASGILGFAKGFLPFLSEAWTLKKYLRRRCVRVVNVHYPSLSALQFVLIKRWLDPRLKIILSFHGMDLATARQSTRVERWLWKILVKSCDQLVGCSRALTRELLEFFPEAAARTSAIQNGLDVDWVLQSQDLPFSIDPRLSHRPFILNVAAFEPKKGHDVLIRAFKDVRASSGQDVALVLVGVERGTGPAVRRLIAELGLADHVYFFHDIPHDQLRVFYADAAVFCLASRSEGLPLALLEAGAFGRAVAVTSVGGIPELVTDRVTGRLVPPDDVAALSDALCDLIKRPEERTLLGSALRRRVEKDFSWERAYREYLLLSK